MMCWFVSLIRRLFASFNGAKLDSELDAEMAAHLQMAIEENMRRGMPKSEARREALIRFGSVASAGEQHRDARGLRVLDSIAQDCRYALRTMKRDRVFAATAVLILALGIGANVAVFSIVNTIMLRPLPFPSSEQLVWLTVGNGQGGLSATTYTVDAYEEFKKHNQSFQQVTAYNPFLGNSETKLVGRGDPVPVAGLMVDGDFFGTLGVTPLRGRLFAPEECKSGGRPAAILSYSFWKRQFGGDPSIVGNTISLDKTDATVVGVLPESFDFGSVFRPGTRMDVFVPAPLDELRNWGNTLALVGRLKPGIPVSQAQAEANVLFPQLKATHPDWEMDYSSTITGLKEHVSESLNHPLCLLWGAVGLIFLIVCVNLANLMLARAATRSKEFALRNALGAARTRILFQLVTESVVLWALGAIVGLGFGVAMTFYIAHQGEITLPLLSSVRVDGATLLWACLISALAISLFGVVPALRASGGGLLEPLKDSGRGLSEGSSHGWLRSALVVSEVALACVLLVTAGLLLKSFLRVLDVDLGFQPEHTAAIKVDYDDGGNAQRRGAVLQDMLDQVTGIPGIQAAGVTDMLPLDRDRSWLLWAQGPAPRNILEHIAIVRIVTPGYIRAMGVRLISGRDFTWQDKADREPVMIINQRQRNGSGRGRTR